MKAHTVIINKDERTLDLYAKMNNPAISGNFNFSAKMLLTNGYNYALTPVQNISIYNNTPSPINSIELFNLPQQSGSEAYYIMRVPSSALNESMDITFPK